LLPQCEKTHIYKLLITSITKGLNSHERHNNRRGIIDRDHS
jgi:hypothetical protein